jgi:hypothetical protein
MSILNSNLNQIKNQLLELTNNKIVITNIFIINKVTG